MSAVSSESHEPAVEPGQPAAPEHAAGQADFGANEWLVEELYQRYLADPGSVDRAWWSFFADYQPTLPNGTAPSPAPGPGTGTGTGTARPRSSGAAGPAGPRRRSGRSRRAAPACSPEPGSAASCGLRAPRSAGCAGRRPAPSAT